jgi:hypothetical protein
MRDADFISMMFLEISIKKYITMALRISCAKCGKCFAILPHIGLLALE